MNAVLDDIYTMNLATSGKLKLRAKGLLAEGTPETVFEACVLLHEAARIQRLAVDALPACPPATMLASSAEECWCLVEGRDPQGAANAWGQVLRAREGVDAATVKGILSRIAPRFEASQLEFARAVTSSPMLLGKFRLNILQARAIGALAPADRGQARQEIARVLAKFPGAPSFWYLQYRFEEADENRNRAWEALSRAQRLTPNNQRFVALSLVVATWALTPLAAEQYIAGIRGVLERASAEVCLMYALAEINLAEKGSDRKVRWSRARNAVGAGLAKANTEGLRKNLRAAQLLLNELLAGREPTMEIFYLADLADVASTAKPTANVVDLFTTRLRLIGPEPERDAA